MEKWELYKIGWNGIICAKAEGTNCPLRQSEELFQSACTLHEKCKTGVFGLQSGMVME